MLMTRAMWHAWIAVTLLTSMAPYATAEVETALGVNGGSPAETGVPTPEGAKPSPKSLSRLDATPRDLETSPGASDANPHELQTSPSDLEAKSRDSATSLRDLEAGPHELETSPSGAKSRDLETSLRDLDARPRHHDTSGSVLEARSRDSEGREGRARVLEAGSRAPKGGHRTLNRNASELAWRNWLQGPENRDTGVPPRRITPKSVFVAPLNCPDGKRLQGEGCAKKAKISQEEHANHVLAQLNQMQQAGPPPDLEYDYDEPAADATGPLQLDLLPPAPPSAAAQILPFRIPSAIDKKNNDNKPDLQEAELEAELEKLKLELDRLNPPQTLANNYHLLDKYTVALDKPKRDSTTDSTTIGDQGQKEVIYGNISPDPVQYLAINRTDITNINNLQKPSVQTSSTTVPPIDESQDVTKPDSSVDTEPTTAETSASAAEATTQPAHNLKEDERPSKLHPEIDYSDLSEALKIISRYAEVTTDDTYKGVQKKQEEGGPLGTRTRLQHRRKPSPPPPPPPDPYLQRGSAYDDPVPAHVLYPDYFRYPAPRLPAPPPGYPFRHVQEYWARPEQYLGPYAHANPRRHHHSYSQPPRRERRPPAAAAPPRDLYALLGLRHWFSGDGAAER